MRTLYAVRPVSGLFGVLVAVYLTAEVEIGDILNCVDVMLEREWVVLKLVAIVRAEVLVSGKR